MKSGRCARRGDQQRQAAAGRGRQHQRMVVGERDHDRRHAEQHERSGRAPPARHGPDLPPAWSGVASPSKATA